ncbi:TPA: hypothetical protein QCU33_005323 [Bacillus cereus]|nr:hypothetical protein [Bacillus cereus]
MKIIVEDEPTIADTLKIYLLNEGFEAEILGDEYEVLKIRLSTGSPSHFA